MLTVYELTISQKRIRKLKEVRRHSVSLLARAEQGSGQDFCLIWDVVGGKEGGRQLLPLGH